MFERLLDLLLAWVDRIVPFKVLDPFQEGVVLRFGLFQRELGPGFHWIIPFGVEMVLEDNVVPRTVNLGAQSLTTRDGVPVVIGGVVTASISNIRKALLEVEGVDDALKDSCYGVIGQLVGSHTWDELHADDFAGKLTDACKKQASEYGIRIKRVQLSDMARMRAIRLHVDQTNIYKDPS